MMTDRRLVRRQRFRAAFQFQRLHIMLAFLKVAGRLGSIIALILLIVTLLRQLISLVSFLIVVIKIGIIVAFVGTMLLIVLAILRGRQSRRREAEDF
jgi:hypothetical protein